MGLFENDIKVKEIAPGRFEGEVTGNWSVNGNPNGGYLMAMISSAMTEYSDKRSTPIVTANYISRCVPGKVEIIVEEISQTAQFNRYEARLIQGGKERVRSLGTFCVERTDCGIERYETKMPVLAPVANCSPFPDMPTYTLFHNIEMLLDPSSAVWLQGKTSDRSEQKGWVRFCDGRTCDMMSLFLIADSIPPAIFVSQGAVAWVPTIELSTNIRNMPVTEWLRFTLSTRFVTCGLLEADGEVWDNSGKLVSISRQIAQFRKG